MEYWFNNTAGEIRNFRRKTCPLPFCPLQIVHGIPGNETWDWAERVRWLTASWKLTFI